VLAVAPSDCTDDLAAPVPIAWSDTRRLQRNYLPAVLAPALIELADRLTASHLLFADGPAAAAISGGGSRLGSACAPLST